LKFFLPSLALLAASKPGDALYEPGNTVIEKFGNGSATEPAVFIANYLLSAGDTEIIHFLGSGKPAP
jgi:hypothetical protein